MQYISKSLAIHLQQNSNTIAIFSGSHTGFSLTGFPFGFWLIFVWFRFDMDVSRDRFNLIWFGFAFKSTCLHMFDWASTFCTRFALIWFLFELFSFIWTFVALCFLWFCFGKIFIWFGFDSCSCRFGLIWTGFDLWFIQLSNWFGFDVDLMLFRIWLIFFWFTFDSDLNLIGLELILFGFEFVLTYFVIWLFFVWGRLVGICCRFDYRICLCMNVIWLCFDLFCMFSILFWCWYDLNFTAFWIMLWSDLGCFGSDILRLSVHVACIGYNSKAEEIEYERHSDAIEFSINAVLTRASVLLQVLHRCFAIIFFRCHFAYIGSCY